MADGEYGVTETDKTAIITACAGGIGLVTATALRREGWRVIMSDADEDAGLREADRIGAEFRRCDVKDGDQIAALFHGIGRLDLLVNNAGIMGPSCPTWECPVESWRETLEVNLTAQMITCKHAVPIMLSQRSGSIVNMSSVAGRRGWPTRAAYAASKWGVLGFTATLAEEVAPHGVRVNAILPGAVDGDRIQKGIQAYADANDVDYAAAEKHYLDRQPIGRLVPPGDIAETIVFLAGDRATSITGQFIEVSGGYR